MSKETEQDLDRGEIFPILEELRRLGDISAERDEIRAALAGSPEEIRREIENLIDRLVSFSKAVDRGNHEENHQGQDH